MKCTGGSRTSDKGGGGHTDPEIRGGSLQKFFFRLFGPQFRSNNKGERKGGGGGKPPRAPCLDPPRSRMTQISTFLSPL